MLTVRTLTEYCPDTGTFTIIRRAVGSEIDRVTVINAIDLALEPERGVEHVFVSRGKRSE